MSEKVTITKEQAEAIECVKRECYGFSSTLNIHIKNGWTSEEKMPLSQLSAEQLATALIVGYEIERTPHEKARAVYEHYRDCGESYEPSYTGIDVMEAIEGVLDALGEKVEGVNA